MSFEHVWTCLQRPKMWMKKWRTKMADIILSPDVGKPDVRDNKYVKTNWLTGRTSDMPQINLLLLLLLQHQQQQQQQQVTASCKLLPLRGQISKLLNWNEMPDNWIATSKLRARPLPLCIILPCIMPAPSPLAHSPCDLLTCHSDAATGDPKAMTSF